MNLIDILSLVGVLLMFFGLGLLVLVRWSEKQAGLPGGRIIYVDQQNWSAQEEPLYDAVHGLTGRPDYLVRHGEQIIPVEVKSTRHVTTPYDSHIFQLAAYCLLVERVFHHRPRQGIIHYPHSQASGRRSPGVTFALEFTPQLENELTELLQVMHSQQNLKSISRSHQTKVRCKRCGYQSICDQRIA